MKSLLYSDSNRLTEPLTCKPGRVEKKKVFRRGRYLYQFTQREDFCIEDPYLVMVHGAAMVVRQGDDSVIQPLSREAKDVLIKTNIVI